MPQAFDAQNPPFDRLTYAEVAELRERLDIGYWPPGGVIVERGKAAEHLHVVIKGAVEERSGEDVEAVLRAKDSFDARALVHGAAGTSFISAEETLCYLVPKDIVLELIKRNAGFAAFFYMEVSRKLASYVITGGQNGVEQVLRARVRDALRHEASFIDGSATIVEASRLMQERNTNSLFVRDGEHTGIVTGMNLAKAAVLRALPLDTNVRELAHFEIFSVDAGDFIFEALIKMTRHNKRRLAVTQNGEFAGTLEDIDILGLVAGNSQLVPGRIDRARCVEDLEAPACDIQTQVERLHRQGVEVDVIAEITSDLNRALIAKLYSLIAPESIKEAGCLMIMGSEGRGEQTVRTDQDNGLLLAHPVPEADLARFRADFTAALEQFGFPVCPGDVMVRNPQWSLTLEEFLRQLKGWVLTPDAKSAMNLGIFFDAIGIAGRTELVTEAKTVMAGLMRGETAYLIRFAKAIEQFEDATPGVFSSLMAVAGVGSDTVHIKKAGTFPIVHGVRVMSIDKGVIAASTAARLDELARRRILGEEMVRDLKSALSFLMEVRLRSQLRAVRTGRREEEAIVHLSELSARDRDLLREALKVVKRLKEILRHRYNLAQF
jgi:CBS domain-containing protein